MVLRKALHRRNASLYSAKLQSGFFLQQSEFLLQHYRIRWSLTFSLDFEDADGILRVERPHFARGERVSPLDAGRDGRCWLHWFNERLRANNGHPTILYTLSPPKQRLSSSCPLPLSRITSVGPCEDNKVVCVRIYRTALPAVIHQLICI